MPNTPPYRYKYIDEGKAHLHTLDGKPLIGTSTATKILAKPLTWWASGMAVGKLGWINSKLRIEGKYQVVPQKSRLEAVRGQLEAIRGMDETQFLALLDEAYAAHNVKKEESAESGTDLHGLLEQWVKECIKAAGVADRTIKHDPRIEPFVLWAEQNVRKFLWSEAYCFNEELWTGGIADVGWQDNDLNVVAGDFKSSKEAYFDQFVQIAGYDLGLESSGMLTRDGEFIGSVPKVDSYCVIPFGAATFKPQFVHDTKSYREAFKACVLLTKVNNTFN